MLLIQPILLLFLLFFTQNDGSLHLAQEIEKDLKVLNSTPVFISDNTSASPTVQTIANDLQLFQVIASIDLRAGKYSQTTQGNHKIQKWQFPEGQIKAIYQIESVIALDTVVTQRYLENRAPTQHHIRNNFTFRTYAVSTANSPIKLHYFTEAEQGLLEYNIDDRQVQINYPDTKEGLSDILQKVEEEVDRVLHAVMQQ